MQSVRKSIGFLLFDQSTGLDIMGPLEAFATVKEIGLDHYDTYLIGPKAGSFRTEAGIVLCADMSVADAPELDTLVIPGGAGARNPELQRQLVPWLQAKGHQCRRIVSICTGAFLLAESGLLDGKRATTHWGFIEQFQRNYPKVELVPDAIYINHGHIATSAGITAGIDLALNLIEDDLGSEVAAQVARYLVVHYRRSGDQAQFSEPLRFQSKADSKFSALTGWILNNLQQDLSIAALANQSGMSERNFCRRFKQQMGQTPAAYVELLRLDYARQLLADKDWPVKRIAQACGYQHTDVFRRAFERRFSISPKAYRARFTQTA